MTLEREPERAFFEQRVSLFAKVMILIYILLVGFIHVAYEVYPQLEPARARTMTVVALGGLVSFVLLWYFVIHRGRYPVRVLEAVEAFMVLVIGASFALSIYLTYDQIANVYTAFIWCSFMVFGRVIMIPSSGRRTLVLSAGAMGQLMLASIAIAVEHDNAVGLPGPALAIGAVVFCSVAAGLATVGSQVLYGLRKQVREAMQLGQYTLGEKIGEGGMGQVYKASHAMLRRPTAIKLLRKASAADVLRFEREVQLTSELTHPNTIAIFDYGRSPDGVFYYAMEYLDGTDLESLVREEGPLPSDRVTAILAQVCGALDEAHARDLVHRDIKPANVLLCRRGRDPDVVKVVDFGLIKEVGNGQASQSHLIAGTPAYLAPEAVTDAETVGPASDLYALGAVGYFLLTGQTVFTGATAADMCIKQVSATPVPPSQRTDRPVSPALEALIMRCLDKDPARRPDGAWSMRTELLALPPAGDFSVEQGRAWWQQFEIRRRVDGRRPPVAAPTTRMTVDLRDRARPAR